MDRSMVRKKLLDTLETVVGKREALNITDYYLDATVSSDYKFLDEHLNDLISGHPVQYVTNTSFFYGYKLYVDKNTLIPRPETEELVHWIITDYKQSKFNIVDIGTGSGCILLSVLHKCPEASGLGIDVDSRVQKVFDINKQRLNVNADLKALDFLVESTWNSIKSFDVIVSNPPYISKDEVNRLGENVFRHEPHLALFTDDDPLVFYRKTIAFAHTHLNEGGCIYFETSDLYHDEMVSLAKNSGFQSEFKKDMQGAWRMLKLWR